MRNSGQAAGVAGLVAISLLGLALSGCPSPPKTCSTDDDCFEGERCNAEGICVSTGDAEDGGSEEDVGGGADGETTDAMDVEPDVPTRCRENPKAVGCPCNFSGLDEGVCRNQVRTETGRCSRPSKYEQDESLCDDLDNDCDGTVDGWSAGCESTKMLGSTMDDVATGVTVDASGNVYVAGWTNGQLPGSSNREGKREGFVAKYDVEGRRRWTKLLTTMDDDAILGIESGEANDVYVAGRSAGRIGGGTNVKGASTGFVARISSSGATEWVTRVDSKSEDRLLDLAVAPSDDALFAVGEVTGELRGTSPSEANVPVVAKLDTDSGDVDETLLLGRGHAGRFTAVSSYRDRLFAAGIESVGAQAQKQSLLAEIDPTALSLTQAVQTGDPNRDERPMAIVPRSRAPVEVLVAGQVALRDRMNPWTDAFLRKRTADDLSREANWGERVGSDNVDAARGMALNDAGTIYMVGRTQGDIDRDQNIDPKGNSDGFLVKLASDGTYLSADYIGSPEGDGALDVVTTTATPEPRTFVVGWTRGEPGAASNAGEKDAFIVKYE